MNWLQNLFFLWIKWLDSVTFRFFDFGPDQALSTGTVPSTGAGLTIAAADFSATIYVEGYRRGDVDSPAHTYNVSADTYWDLGRDCVWTPIPVANGSPAPALTPLSVRVYIVVTDATNRTSVTDLRKSHIKLESKFDLDEEIRLGEDLVDTKPNTVKPRVTINRAKLSIGGLYTLLYEGTGKETLPNIPVRIYARNAQLSDVVITFGARWEPVAAEWIPDLAIAATVLKWEFGTRFRFASKLFTGATSAFPDSEWKFDGAFTSEQMTIPGNLFVGSGLDGTSPAGALDGEAARFAANRILDSISLRTLLFRSTASDFISDPIRLYGTESGTGGLGHALEITIGALWVQSALEWRDDGTSGTDSFKIDFSPTGVRILRHLNSAGSIWSDVIGAGDWVTLHTFGTNFSTSGSMSGTKAILSSNPAVGTAFGNELHAKNIPKAWVTYSDDGIGGLSIIDGYNIATVAWNAGTSSAEIVFAQTMDGIACAVATYSHEGLSNPVRVMVARTVTTAKADIQHYDSSGVVIDQSLTSHGRTSVAIFALKS